MLYGYLDAYVYAGEELNGSVIKGFSDPEVSLDAKPEAKKSATKEANPQVKKAQVSSTSTLLPHSENASPTLTSENFSLEVLRPLEGIYAGLVNLNPEVSRWFLLVLFDPKVKKSKILHIDNPHPKHTLSLVDKGLNISKPNGKKELCKLWGAESEKLFLFDFKTHVNPYKPLCDGKLLLRLSRSSKTRLSMTEWGTSVLRQSEYGEAIINAFKPWLVSFKAEDAEGVDSKKEVGGLPDAHPFPARAFADEAFKKKAIGKHSLGVNVVSSDSHLKYGEWYQSKLHEGVYVSLMAKYAINKSIFDQHKNLVDKIPSGVKDKLAYAVAYDLEKYSVGYVKGTTHPEVSLKGSNIGNGLQRDLRDLGVQSVKALRESVVPIGSVPPEMLKRSVSVFVGGYKARHSTFYSGPHRGKTFGLVEEGFKWSKLEEGLATIYTLNDDSVHIGKWPSADNSAGKHIHKSVLSARQNGVVLIDNGVPGDLVNKRRFGNWSGDARGNLATLRSGVCIQSKNSKKFLIFFAMTSATPSSSARLMQSYHCDHGMQLDMNAYMYLHNVLFDIGEDGKVAAEYLHQEMEYPKGIKRHRYILDNNERDFFYIFRK